MIDIKEKKVWKSTRLGWCLAKVFVDPFVYHKGHVSCEDHQTSRPWCSYLPFVSHHKPSILPFPRPCATLYDGHWRRRRMGTIFCRSSGDTGGNLASSSRRPRLPPDRGPEHRCGSSVGSLRRLYARCEEPHDGRILRTIVSFRGAAWPGASYFAAFALRRRPTVPGGWDLRVPRPGPVEPAAAEGQPYDNRLQPWQVLQCGARFVGFAGGGRECGAVALHQKRLWVGLSPPMAPLKGNGSWLLFACWLLKW